MSRLRAAQPSTFQASLDGGSPPHARNYWKAGYVDTLSSDLIDQLVEHGLILPLNSVASRVIVTMRNGSMPPPTSGYPLVPDSDANIVASYIDNPRYWPTFVPAPIADAGTEAPIADAGADGG